MPLFSLWRPSSRPPPEPLRRTGRRRTGRSPRRSTARPWWSSITRTDGTTIFLDLAYARLVIRLAPSNPARTVAVDTFAKARAVYFLLHEYGHVVHWHERADGFEPERELRANQFAAQQFRAFCRERLALSDAAVQQLWAALPPTWQRPTAADMPQPG